MSRLPPFHPSDAGNYHPAIPASPATPDGQTSGNSGNSKSTCGTRAEPPNKGGYRLKYPAGDRATNAELAELEKQVDTKGYVLLWSNLLEDFIAFYRSEADFQLIPDWFVPYSQRELWELFGEGDSGPSPNGLRLIHEAKKQGERVIQHQSGDQE